MQQQRRWRRDSGPVRRAGERSTRVRGTVRVGGGRLRVASESAAAGGPTVNLGDTSLGSVLVDGDGKTLYIFTADTGGKSVCNGDCAAAWPPLLGDAAPTLGTGLTATDFTTITRDDGATQIAFFGMPLYYFAADAAAGDVKGQGLNDKWYVIGADGAPIK